MRVRTITRRLQIKQISVLALFPKWRPIFVTAHFFANETCYLFQQSLCLLLMSAVQLNNVICFATAFFLQSQQINCVKNANVCVLC